MCDPRPRARASWLGSIARNDNPGAWSPLDPMYDAVCVCASNAAFRANAAGDAVQPARITLGVCTPSRRLPAQARLKWYHSRACSGAESRAVEDLVGVQLACVAGVRGWGAWMGRVDEVRACGCVDGVHGCGCVHGVRAWGAWMWARGWGAWMGCVDGVCRWAVWMLVRGCWCAVRDALQSERRGGGWP